jgi:hypothetical protein
MRRTATIAFAQNICTPVGVTVRTTAGCDNSTSSGNASMTATAVASTTSKAGAASTGHVLHYVGNAVGLAAAAGAFAALL